MLIMNDDNLYPRFSESELANRYERVRASMQEAGVSALLLYGTAGSYQEIQFLSNFLVTREATLVFPQDRRTNNVYPILQPPPKRSQGIIY